MAFTLNTEQVADVERMQTLLVDVARPHWRDDYLSHDEVELPAWYVEDWADCEHDVVRRHFAYMRRRQAAPALISQEWLDTVLAEHGQAGLLLALKQEVAEAQLAAAVEALLRLDLDHLVSELEDRHRVEMTEVQDEDAPFRGRADRLERDLATLHDAERASFTATLAAIRALPTVARSSTGSKRPAGRRRAQAPRGPDDPSPRSSAELAAELRSVGFDRALADALRVAEMQPELDEPSRLRAWVAEYVLNRLRLSDVANEIDCPCGCGPFVPSRPNQTYASASCRKRAERQRKRRTDLDLREPE